MGLRLRLHQRQELRQQEGAAVRGPVAVQLQRAAVPEGAAQRLRQQHLQHRRKTWTRFITCREAARLSASGK